MPEFSVSAILAPSPTHETIIFSQYTHFSNLYEERSTVQLLNKWINLLSGPLQQGDTCSYCNGKGCVKCGQGGTYVSLF